MPSPTPPGFDDGCTPGQRAYLQHIDTLPYSPWLQDWPELSDAVRKLWDENGAEKLSQEEIENEVRLNLANRHKEEEVAWARDRDGVMAEVGRKPPVKPRVGMQTSLVVGKGKGRQVWREEDRGDVGDTVTAAKKKKKKKRKLHEMMETVEGEDMVYNDAFTAKREFGKKKKVTVPGATRQPLPLQQQRESESLPTPSPPPVGVPLSAPTPEPITPIPPRTTDSTPSWLSHLRKLVHKSSTITEPTTEPIPVLERGTSPTSALVSDLHGTENTYEEIQQECVSPYESINNGSATPPPDPTPAPTQKLSTESRQDSGAQFNQPLPAITNSALGPRSGSHSSSTSVPPFASISSQPRIQSLTNTQVYQSPYLTPRPYGPFAQYGNPSTTPSGTIFSIVPQTTAAPKFSFTSSWAENSKLRPKPPLFKFTNGSATPVTPANGNGEKGASGDQVTSELRRYRQMLPPPRSQGGCSLQEFADLLGIALYTGAPIPRLPPNWSSSFQSRLIEARRPVLNSQMGEQLHTDASGETNEPAEPHLHRDRVPIALEASRLAIPDNLPSSVAGTIQHAYIENPMVSCLVTVTDGVATSVQQNEVKSAAGNATSSNASPTPEVNLNSTSKQREEYLTGIEEIAQSFEENTSAASNTPSPIPNPTPDARLKLTPKQRQDILRGIENAGQGAVEDQHPAQPQLPISPPPPPPPQRLTVKQRLANLRKSENAAPAFNEDQDITQTQHQPSFSPTQSSPSPRLTVKQRLAILRSITDAAPGPNQHRDQDQHVPPRHPLPSSLPSPHPHELPRARTPLPSAPTTPLNNPPRSYCIQNPISTHPCRGGPPCILCRSVGRRAWECAGGDGENMGKNMGKMGNEGEQQEGRRERKR